MTFRLLSFLLLMLGFTLPATAQSFDQVAQADILPGWRNPDGTHVAAIQITLNPGWHTYWRAPGDAGIPPQIRWDGSRNLSAIEVNWPTPEVFLQGGLRSIGYEDKLILPVRITPKSPAKTVRLKAVLDVGVCRDICVPMKFKVKAELPVDGKRDARIAAALVDRPLHRDEAGVRGATCKLSPTQDGLKLTARVDMPSAGGSEVAVIETDNPHVWVAEGSTRRQGSALITETELVHVDGTAFILDRSAIRITVLGTRHAVDIQGCTG
ncbi:protein-disulfide reductase DsbD domain-containing protein [Shimia sp.]|uniref:protein-disulfide reductase DsbD domain-containing protein n=1 Tax=Shimia sp. TaxID=1954381 RepID=UPI003299BA94